MDPLAEKALAEVRFVAMSLPCATEKLSHGEPTWFIDGKKCFATFCTYHHGSRLGVIFAAPIGVQAMLVSSEPDKFYVPPYVGGRGWIGMNLDIPFDSEELADLLTEAYRTVAPPKYLRFFGQG